MINILLYKIIRLKENISFYYFIKHFSEKNKLNNHVFWLELVNTVHVYYISITNLQ